MSRTWPTWEVDIGNAIAPALLARGFKLYDEVPIPGATDARGETLIPDRIAVSVREGLLEIFELKPHVGVDLVADAERWVGYCHRSWGVAPMVQRDRRKSPAFLQACLAFKRAGAGLILVAEDGTWERIVVPRFTPTHRIVVVGIMEALQDARPGYAKAGSPGRAKRFTKTTERNANLDQALAEVVAKHPLKGLPVRKAMREVKAPPSTFYRLRDGRVAGVRLEKNGRVYPIEGTAAA